MPPRRLVRSTILMDNLGFGHSCRLFAFGKLSVKSGDSFHPWGVFVRRGPLPEKLLTFFFNLGVRNWISSCNPQSLKQRFICKQSQETVAGVLNKKVEDREGPQLPMYISVLTGAALESCTEEGGQLFLSLTASFSKHDWPRRGRYFGCVWPQQGQQFHWSHRPHTFRLSASRSAR